MRVWRLHFGHVSCAGIRPTPKGYCLKNGVYLVAETLLRQYEIFSSREEEDCAHRDCINWDQSSQRTLYYKKNEDTVTRRVHSKFCRKRKNKRIEKWGGQYEWWKHFLPWERQWRRKIWLQLTIILILPSIIWDWMIK